MLPEEPLRILRYWFDVEALAAPDAERHDGSCDKFTVRYVRDGSYRGKRGSHSREGTSFGSA
jgi:hypothetical protein